MSGYTHNYAVHSCFNQYTCLTQNDVEGLVDKLDGELEARVAQVELDGLEDGGYPLGFVQLEYGNGNSASHQEEDDKCSDLERKQRGGSRLL